MSTAAIFFIVVGAFIFSRFIVLTQFPNELTAWVQGMGLSAFWIIMAVMALYILLGTFLAAALIIVWFTRAAAHPDTHA